MEAIASHIRHFGEKLNSLKVQLPSFLSKQRFFVLMQRVKSIGLVKTMEEYDQRKLSIFNQLNFFQLLTGILIPIAGLISSRGLSFTAWLVACAPALVSVLVLYLNKIYRHEAALMVYFILYPFVTCIIYLYGLNLGISLFFIFFGIMAVFFLKDGGYIIFSLGFSMVSFFILSVILKHYIYDLQKINNSLYLFNHFISLGFIFYGLYLVKKENTGYQSSILANNIELKEKNYQIQQQKLKLEENAVLLKRQASELADLNKSKNKLFSIISHDLKAPLYALRNLFNDVHHQKMSATDLNTMVPDVLNDLNNTVGLMENLLQWAKAQMQSNESNPQNVEIDTCITDVLQLLQLQAKAKEIQIQYSPNQELFGYADKGMILLVLRNLISNAIKFTPRNGTICIGAEEHDTFIEIYVQDNGAGMTPEVLAKVNSHEFYTTNGTASETGTGLGLMLCKEFLAKNGGNLHIDSEPGVGSVFSFTIPKSM
jgi:signal transduction histidine kinase